ncbi:hypothetical protein ACOSQ2_002458 [Xanthoceras sorbifolium]
MAVLGDFVYVIGSGLYHRTPGHDSNEALEVRWSVLRYNIRDGVWFKCTLMRSPRFDFACAVCDGRICVVGGQSMISTLLDMSMLRYKCVGVAWQGRFHMVGGFAERGYSDSDRVDLIVGMWQLDVPPNQIVTVDDKLFSFDDCFKSWKGYIKVDGSHLETLSSPISTLDEAWPPIQRLYITMALIGTQLYFLEVIDCQFST